MPSPSVGKQKPEQDMKVPTAGDLVDVHDRQ